MKLTFLEENIPVVMVTQVLLSVAGCAQLQHRSGDRDWVLRDAGGGHESCR